MRIRIDDDYDMNDLKNFHMDSSKNNENEHQSYREELKIVDTVFKEVVEEENYNYAGDYKDYYSTYTTTDVSEVDSNISGKIYVTSRLANKNRTLISSAKINLYALNGVSPKLVQSKYTDNEGKTVFENLKKGSYRIIAIVDRKYFEKPTYTPWNEVTIDANTNETSIEVINKIKGV